MTAATAPTTLSPVPAAAPTAAPAPRWARRAAHAIALCAVPSGLWRLAMAVGIPVGFSAEVLRTDYSIPGWGIAYVIGLAVLQECAALLPLLLVTERVRLPRPRAVATTAMAAAVFVTLLCLSQLVMWFTVGHDGRLTGTTAAVMGWCYAPLLATGPLLAVVARSYRMRHAA
ncbi:hypothetical protein [Streptomyces sp. SYSU K21746]